MAKVKLDIDDKSVPEKLAMAQTVITQSTNNANLPDANPVTVANLNNKRYTLQVALAHAGAMRQAAKAATQALNDAEAAFDAALSAHGAYVQNGTLGVAEKILTTGLGVAAEGQSPAPLTAPADYEVTAGDEPGELHAAWEPQKAARTWETQVTTDPTGATGWGNSAFSTKSNVDVQGLVSGTMYLVRTRGIGAAGSGPWSQTVQRRSP